jgi:hypothetical protein
MCVVVWCNFVENLSENISVKIEFREINPCRLSSSSTSFLFTSRIICSSCFCSLFSASSLFFQMSMAEVEIMLIMAIKH